MLISTFSSALLHDFWDGLNIEEFHVVKLYFPKPPCKVEVKISVGKCLYRSLCLSLLRIFYIPWIVPVASTHELTVISMASYVV